MGRWGDGIGDSRPCQNCLLRFWKEEELNLKEGSLLEGKRRGGGLGSPLTQEGDGEGQGCAGFYPAGALTESKGGKVG